MARPRPSGRISSTRSPRAACCNRRSERVGCSHPDSTGSRTPDIQDCRFASSLLTIRQPGLTLCVMESHRLFSHIHTYEIAPLISLNHAVSHSLSPPYLPLLHSNCNIFRHRTVYGLLRKSLTRKHTRYTPPTNAVTQKLVGRKNGREARPLSVAAD